MRPSQTNMCGICGVVQHKPVDLQRLETMRDTLTHRGPDDAGLWTNGSVQAFGRSGVRALEPSGGPVAPARSNARTPERQPWSVGLAHRRLSILDLSPLGRQPLSNEDGSVWIVFNGEVYNFRNLRSELEERGHRFRSRTDTEVLVHLYEEEGEAFVERLRGMFALAIWDDRRGELILARDRAGKKPLYYAEGPWGLAFASEIKALIAWPGVSRELDASGLNEYLALGYLSGAASIFRDIRKLPPAHTLTFRDGAVRLRRYWNLPNDDDEGTRLGEVGSLADTEALLEETLSEAVRLRMISDVPLGVFLSGGVDSSLVAGLMRRHATGPLRTFSIGFAEERYNELRYARQVATQLEAEHHEFVVRPDAVAVVQELARQFDEPFADASAVPTYYVSRLARETVTVALAGDGGDELFAGYNWYAWMQRSQRAAAWLGPAARPLGALAHRLPGGVGRRALVRGLAEQPAERWARRTFLFSAAARSALLSPGLVGDTPDAPERAVAAALTGRGDFTRRMQRLDFGCYLPDDILVKVDRASMLVSLEVRAPLLDHHLCELAFRLPSSLHTRGGVRKYLAKRLARRLFPEVDFERKQGFSIPLAEWMRGDLSPMLDAQLAGPRLRDVVNIAAAERFRDEHASGIADHGPRLWALLMLGLWLEEYRPDLPSAAGRAGGVDQLCGSGRQTIGK
jgi:asparagine synthase (glutamine-hydrolysing)